ncbi:MAG: serine protease [Planctomycetota bacterium]|nr:MAG: serine protease [Planctomycetota bacterium]
MRFVGFDLTRLAARFLPVRPASAAIALVLAAFAASANAQDLTPAERTRIYDDLERDAKEIDRFAGVLKKVALLAKETVVHIEADKDVESSGRHVEEAGSGVVVEIAGRNCVVTNRHVVRGAAPQRIKIRLADGRELQPKQVWTDEDTDLAVLALDRKDDRDDNIVAARLGDSDRLDIGDMVLAVGSPFGLSHSVTFGIISARNRRNLALGDSGLKYQDFLQTDASINPGNSGGPLLNLRGEVVGINTAIATESGKNEGIGFAIPANMVAPVVRQLVEKGRVQRAFLGVNLDARFGVAAAQRLGLNRPLGALVKEIIPRSPADAAKIAAGDVIVRFNETRVDDDTHLVNLVALTPVGSEVPVVVLRDRKEVRLTVKVGEKISGQ